MFKHLFCPTYLWNDCFSTICFLFIHQQVEMNGTFVWSVKLHALPDRWQCAQTDSCIQICFLFSLLSRIDLNFKTSSGKQSSLKKQFVILSPNREISFLVLRMEQFSIRSFTDLINTFFSSWSTSSSKKPISNTVLTHTSNAIQKLWWQHPKYSCLDRKSTACRQLDIVENTYNFLVLM